MVDIVDKKVREHGFQLPWHPSQVFTWILFAGDVLTFYFVDIVSLHHNLPLVLLLSIIYFILACGTVYYA